jgi:hypothetical protein
MIEGLREEDFEKFGRALVETFEVCLADEPERQRMMGSVSV